LTGYHCLSEPDIYTVRLLTLFDQVQLYKCELGSLISSLCLNEQNISLRLLLKAELQDIYKVRRLTLFYRCELCIHTSPLSFSGPDLLKVRLVTLFHQVHLYRCDLGSHISSLSLSEQYIYKERLVTVCDQVHFYRYELSSWS
jgi:hypothetical protein